jgi:uncharacterized pyridoxamine 5'-phosphate oxidase family protein
MCVDEKIAFCGTPQRQIHERLIIKIKCLNIFLFMFIIKAYKLLENIYSTALERIKLFYVANYLDLFCNYRK